MMPVFDKVARRNFAAHYPEIPHKLPHNLRDHPLLTIEALARLGEALPAASVEYNKGDLPVGVDPAQVPANGLSVGDTIRLVETSGSWAVLKNIEQQPQYKELLVGLLAELKPQIESKTGRMLKPQLAIQLPPRISPRAAVVTQIVVAMRQSLREVAQFVLPQQA